MVWLLLIFMVLPVIMALIISSFLVNLDDQCAHLTTLKQKPMCS
ncbi:hypothetical protein Lser_V15G14979 [Lactuca serriola]